MNKDNMLLLISLITGFIGMPIIQAIKKAFKLEDKWALLIATVISLILGILVTFIGGHAIDQPVTIELVIESMTAVFSVASIFYKVLLGDKRKSTDYLEK